VEQRVSRRTLLAGAAGALALAGCGGSSPVAARGSAVVPVLCYHDVRDWLPRDNPRGRQILVLPPDRFRNQLDTLAEAGFTTIGPDAYAAHVATGAALPDRPVLLSFDDSRGNQATAVLPELEQRAMTGTFFVMTIVLDDPGWLSRDDLRRMADAGMTVAAHTYDHKRVDRYGEQDWAVQLEQPREELERVVGRPVEHFAYPGGNWHPPALERLTAAGYRSAYQLSAQPTDPDAPLLTLRRVLVDSAWQGPSLLEALKAASRPA
jgi:peptidoglycan/xylan/chitin deacetylase (PgdA/CDA1 family)